MVNAASVFDEGWYVDPFGLHEQRWFSGGAPTDLVCDGEVTARDLPPTRTWDPPALPLEPVVANGGADLIRADAEPPKVTLDGSGPGLDREQQLSELRKPWWNRRMPIGLGLVLGGMAVVFRIFLDVWLRSR